MFCCVYAADDSNAEWADITSDDSFVGTGNTIKYTVHGDQKYYYKAEIQTADGSTSALGSVSVASSYLTTTSTSGGYYRTLTVTAPSTAGDYLLSVKYYGSDDSSYTTVLFEKKAPIKVVEPVVLSFTLKNNSSSDLSLKVYFVINGEKVTDSSGTQDITVTANSTKTVTYNYIVKDISNTTYKLCCDDSVLSGSVSGLDVEKKFYTSQTDYTWLTVLMVVVLVLFVILFIYVVRKPVVNKGKPKGRR